MPRGIVCPPELVIDASARPIYSVVCTVKLKFWIHLYQPVLNTPNISTFKIFNSFVQILSTEMDRHKDRNSKFQEGEKEKCSVEGEVIN
ncbi:hypothetical protein A4A49_57526 [Nicotiana attenuata]|uniref:Uncharacterized protein n=1 Tax=Nicotiana attenuata TaxID=49451 RepID=A0A1J6IG51_NICAT|nr:hypothetical protein A4A49_57526 [Nicotiana attenuata]